jgi:hypothetical protein
MNQTLRNIANWGYWTGTGTYGLASNRAGAPYFEALQGGVFNIHQTY